MKEKLLIVGAGGFGRVTLEHASKEFKCSFLDDAKNKGEIVNGAKVIGKVKDLALLFGSYKKIVISIGDNKTRRRIYKEAKQIGFEFPNIICTSVYVSPFAKVGEGCIFLNNANVQNGSIVGNATILNPGVEVHHDSSVGDFCCIYTNSVIRTYARVEDGVKIGSNVTVSNGKVVEADIEDGVVI